MINEMLIHRFRGIRRGHLKDIGKINILVGPNNSGKTALLELLYLSGNCGEKCNLMGKDETLVPVRVSRGADFVFHSPMERLWKRHGEKERWDTAPCKLTPDGSLECRLDFLEKSHFLREFRLIKPQSETLEYGGFTEDDRRTLTFFSCDDTDAPSGDDEEETNPRALLPEEMLPEFLKDALKEEEKAHIAFQWHKSLIFQGNNGRGVSAWILKGRLPDPDRVFLFDFHTAHGHFFKEFFEFAYYKIPDWYEKIAHGMQQVFADMKDCRIEFVPSPRREGMMTGSVRLPGNMPLHIDSFGDGARHAFKVIAGLSALCETVNEEHPGGLFLWEDPELFMHPQALFNLMKVVTTFLRDKPMQLFITTQSMEVCAAMVSLLQNEKIREEDFRLFRLKLKNSTLISSKFLSESLLSWMQNEEDPRFWEYSTLPLRYIFKHNEETE